MIGKCSGGYGEMITPAREDRVIYLDKFSDAKPKEDSVPVLIISASGLSRVAYESRGKWFFSR